MLIRRAQPHRVTDLHNDSASVHLLAIARALATATVPTYYMGSTTRMA